MNERTVRKLLERFNLGIYHPFPRSMTRFAQKNLGKQLVGAEVGVFEANHARSLMESLDIKKLYLVDPYEEYLGYGSDEKNSAEILRNARRIAEKKMSIFGDRVEFIRKTSVDALADLPDNLDFAYIDGNHEYQFVKKDMEGYYQKVRDGGILGGHDIQNGSCSEHDGVLKAFVEFVTEKKLKPYILVPDWWVIKNGTQ